ncbi:MAG: histidine--tRNA ligase [Armatimonadota bacterium]
MPSRYKAPRGTQDVLPEVSWRYQRVEAAFRDVCRRYSYREIRTPLFEETELFERGTGEGTEIVTKQMYTFEDRGGRSLTLRPEGTPPVVRAVLEHNLTAQGRLAKLYYIAPIFRYERPQAGRYRQHTQLGIEAIGAPGPDIDAEVIALYHDFLKEVGLEGGVTHISSIGCPNCRPGFSRVLREFFAPKIEEMCEFCQARYETNPLRILDCKVPEDVAAREGAPSALDYLCDECRAHFAGVRELLDALAIPYQVDPTIVRGLDYYTRTTFEVIHPALGAKDVIMGGGRYDGLVEALGGSPTPGIGFGSGLERLILVLSAAAASPPLERGAGGEDLLAAYVAAASPQVRKPAFLLATELRRAGLSAEVDYTHRSLKAQMREAARLGARMAILTGEGELAAGTVTLRDMVTGEQTSPARTEAIAAIRRNLAGTPEDRP